MSGSHPGRRPSHQFRFVEAPTFESDDDDIASTNSSMSSHTAEPRETVFSRTSGSGTSAEAQEAAPNNGVGALRISVSDDSQPPQQEMPHLLHAGDVLQFCGDTAEHEENDGNGANPIAIRVIPASPRAQASAEADTEAQDEEEDDDVGRPSLFRYVSGNELSQAPQQTRAQPSAAARSGVPPLRLNIANGNGSANGNVAAEEPSPRLFHFVGVESPRPSQMKKRSPSFHFKAFDEEHDDGKEERSGEDAHNQVHAKTPQPFSIHVSRPSGTEMVLRQGSLFRFVGSQNAAAHADEHVDGSGLKIEIMEEEEAETVARLGLSPRSMAPVAGGVVQAGANKADPSSPNGVSVSMSTHGRRPSRVAVLPKGALIKLLASGVNNDDTGRAVVELDSLAGTPRSQCSDADSAVFQYLGANMEEAHNFVINIEPPTPRPNSVTISEEALSGYGWASGSEDTGSPRLFHFVGAPQSTLDNGAGLSIKVQPPSPRPEDKAASMVKSTSRSSAGSKKHRRVDSGGSASKRSSKLSLLNSDGSIEEEDAHAHTRSHTDEARTHSAFAGTEAEYSTDGHHADEDDGDNEDDDADDDSGEPDSPKLFHFVTEPICQEPNGAGLVIAVDDSSALPSERSGGGNDAGSRDGSSGRDNRVGHRRKKSASESTGLNLLIHTSTDALDTRMGAGEDTDLPSPVLFQFKVQADSSDRDIERERLHSVLDNVTHGTDTDVPTPIDWLSMGTFRAHQHAVAGQNRSTSDDGADKVPKLKRLVSSDADDVAAAQFLRSEELYVDLLNNLDDMYIQPLGTRAARRKIGCSQTFYNEVFGNAPQLIELHRTLLDAMLRRPYSGGLLLEFADFLPEFEHVYKAYLRHFQHCMEETLPSLTENPKLKHFYLRQLHSDECADVLSLVTLLYMPLQRLHRYRVHLQAVYEQLSAEHRTVEVEAAYEASTNSVDALLKLHAEQHDVNDRLATLLDIELAIDGLGSSLITEERRLLREGTLTCEYQGEQMKVFRFFLFNDCLLFSRPPPISQYVHRILLRRAAVSVHNLSFEVYTLEQSLRLWFDDKAQMDSWLAAVTDAVKDAKCAARRSGLGRSRAYHTNTYQADSSSVHLHKHAHTASVTSNISQAKSITSTSTNASSTGPHRIVRRPKPRREQELASLFEADDNDTQVLARAAGDAQSSGAHRRNNSV